MSITTLYLSVCLLLLSGLLAPGPPLSLCALDLYTSPTMISPHTLYLVICSGIWGLDALQYPFMATKSKQQPEGDCVQLARVKSLISTGAFLFPLDSVRLDMQDF